MTAPVAGRTDRAVRGVMAAVVAAVAGVAAWTSYLHTVAVVVDHGEDASTARLIPVTTDGLIVAAGLVLLYSARSGRKAPRLARFMLAAGIAATLATNALHGVAHGPVGALVAAWPAATFVGVSELALWLIRASGRAQHTDAPTAVSAAPVEPYASAVRMPHSSPNLGDESSAAAVQLPVVGRADVDEHGQVDEHDEWAPATLPARPAAANTSRRPATVTAIVTAPVTEPATAPVSVRPASRRPAATPATGQVATVAGWLAEDPAMSGAAIAARLGVSERTGRRLRAAATSSQ